MSALHPTSDVHGPCHHILVFDSGLGGLSVAREIIAAAPHACISYLADTAFFPYGTKSDEQLISRIESLLEKAILSLAPDIVVIACNTASTLALSHLRARFNLPFVGVVPAIKPAASLSRSKTFGLLATPATVSRAYTAQLIADFAADCTVVRFGSHNLVTLAEASLCGLAPSAAALERELAGLLAQPGAEAIDTVVLACTHFPLLLEGLKSAAPHIRHWVDSGAAVARQVGVWQQRVAPSVKAVETVRFFSTEPYEQLQVSQVERLLGRAVLMDLGLVLPAPSNTATGFVHVEN
ncbi:MAG: glutamate racemase [Marinagarivorans sp.]